MFDPTEIFTAIADAFNFLDKISPALNDWIESNVPAHKQHELTVRMRRCKTHCRHGHYGVVQIKTLVDIDFTDLSDAQRLDVYRLLVFELLKISLPL